MAFNNLLQSFAARGSALLSSGVGTPGILAFNEDVTDLNTPTDDAGSQSFFSLDLQNFSDGENSAQAWTRTSTGLAPTDPFSPPIETPRLGVRGQRDLVPADGGERSKGQQIRDWNETVKGEFISGNEYLETTGRIDARARSSQADLDREANFGLGGNRDNDAFFANPSVAAGKRENDEFFARTAASNAASAETDPGGGQAAREFMAQAQKQIKSNPTAYVY